jgi:cytochrome b
MSETNSSVMVWDLPVRIGHWLLAGSFLVAWLTGESEEWRLVHVVAGGTMVGVALFRVLWGLIGSRYALFVDFVRGPQAVLSYLTSLLGRKPQHYVGHNPAGGWAIVALLALTLLSGFSGWLNYQDIGGDWTAELHELAANAMLLVVLVHLAGVAVGSYKHGENLPRTMVTGLKSAHHTDRIPSARPIAAALMLAFAGAVAWLLSR